MEYDLSYDNSPSLKQALVDMLRGFKKPEAWQEVGQGIQNTAKVIPSVAESLGRGAIAQVPGMIGDISQLARQYLPMQNIMGNRVAPTTEEILQAVPRMTPNYEGSQQHEMVGELTGPALAKMLKMGAEATKGMPIGNMIAYHGTPHEIKGGFDISKVGTGEGVQAYGHGMYFAENPKVAEAYKTQDIPIKNLNAASGKSFDSIEDFFNEVKPKNVGNLYKVDIPDEYIPTMIEWDKQLKDQPELVKNFIKKHTKELTEDMHEWMPQSKNDNIWDRMRGIDLMFWANELYGKEKAAKFLDSQGIKGIKYFDEQSRKEKKGTSNYVVFNPQEVKILEKNNQPISRKEILEKELNNLK